jgi:hypothetical protein
MKAFNLGRKYYRIYRDSGNGKRTNSSNYENPYDPDCTDYESFFDGWCHERDNV